MNGIPNETPVCRQDTRPLTYDWNGWTHEMPRPDWTDIHVAGKVRMLMRGDLDHEMVCTVARDRIMALSKEIVRIEAVNCDLLAALKAIKQYGELANLSVDTWPNTSSGKKPASKDVWAFPRHMLVEVDAAIAAAGDA